MKRVNRLRLAAAVACVAVIGVVSPPAHGAAEGAPAGARTTDAPPPRACRQGDHKLTIVVTTDKANVADGDRLWDSHHVYMRSSHQDFLITYALAKGPERSNPLDPASAATGRTTYALDECYRTGADIGKHWKKAAAEWKDFNALVTWMRRPHTQVVTLHDGTVRNSLWQPGKVH
ncbi:hypothetical protein [Streptomyces syringium]|uniref:Uncharacterized protein n=1 Tax=Streptomyces syringium TaxID=76729 RepID=A0ABS4YBK9_9ACTN|nr:hypothetical protein [Streptomyces syringium]MBP2406178.1 hypothetical protein [Streptomyces syringium]